MTREERNENKFVCWLIYVYLSRQMIVHFLKTALGLWPPNLQKPRSSNNINTSHVNTNSLLFILSLRYSVSVIPSFVFFNLTHLIFILQSFFQPFLSVRCWLLLLLLFFFFFLFLFLFFFFFFFLYHYPGSFLLISGAVAKKNCRIAPTCLAILVCLSACNNS